MAKRISMGSWQNLRDFTRKELGFISPSESLDATFFQSLAGKFEAAGYKIEWLLDMMEKDEWPEEDRDTITAGIERAIQWSDIIKFTKDRLALDAPAGMSIAFGNELKDAIGDSEELMDGMTEIIEGWPQEHQNHFFRLFNIKMWNRFQ